MEIPVYPIPVEQALSLDQFKEMDYFAVNNYALPIELMMENAGLQLARLVAAQCDKTAAIQIGVGNGNNGGGGLVAARRLSAWGYKVGIHSFTEITKELPLKQLDRALKFGAKLEELAAPKIWVDAYLGFSQRLPLSDKLLALLKKANQSEAIRISLDIPTGFLGNPTMTFFEAQQVLSLAASKKILYNLPASTLIYVADLGIPGLVYQQFEYQMPPFGPSGLLQLKR